MLGNIRYQVSRVRFQEKGYKKLKVYRESHKLVKNIYSVTESYPKSEIFGLISQMRRSAISVVANIIEGQARNGKKDFLRFLFMSNGSLTELEYYLELSLELQFLNQNQYKKIEEQRIIVGSLLGGLINSIKSNLDT